MKLSASLACWPQLTLVRTTDSLVSVLNTDQTVTDAETAWDPTIKVYSSLIWETVLYHLKYKAMINKI